MANATGLDCPTNAVPATLPIPQDVTYVVIPGTNASDPWMARCCQPNPVQVVNDCWEWCAVPAAITNGSTPSEISSDFNRCLSTNGRNYTQSNGLLTHIANKKSSAASNSRVTLAGTALAALAVSIVFVSMA